MAKKELWDKRFDVMRGTDVYTFGMPGFSRIEFNKGYGKDAWEGRIYTSNRGTYISHDTKAGSLKEARHYYTNLVLMLNPQG